MLAKYKKQANTFLISGFFIWFLGNILKNEALGLSLKPIGWIVFLAGLSLFVYGCTIYSKAKGHHPALGLLGILNLIGLIVLALLPDKHKSK